MMSYCILVHEDVCTVLSAIQCHASSQGSFSFDIFMRLSLLWMMAAVEFYMYITNLMHS